MGITLNIPSQLRIDDYMFRQLKDYLRDEFIWDKGINTCAYANVLLTWTGSTSPAVVGAEVKVYHGDDVHSDSLIISGIYTDANGEFEFPMNLMRGINKIVVEIAGETTSLYLTAYNWAIFMTALAEEMHNFKDEYDQVQRDNILQSSVSPLDITLAGLYKNFGYFTGIKKMLTQTVDEYNTFVTKMFEAYERGDMYSSIRVPINTITGASVFINPWNKEDWIGLDPHFKLKVHNPPSRTIYYEGGIYNISCTNYELLGGYCTVGPNTTTWIYAGTTRDSNGYSQILKSPTRIYPDTDRKVLGWVVANATNVTYISGCHDMDIDAMYSSHETYQSYVDIYVRGNTTTEEKTAIETLVRQNIAAYSRAFIYFDSGEIKRV